MTCPKCKNPIYNNSQECEWCGSELPSNNFNNFNSDNTNFNSHQRVVNVENKKFNVYFLIPGVIVFVIWVFGNILQEHVKQELFGQDDISGWLITSIVFLTLGFIIGLFNKK